MGMGETGFLYSPARDVVPMGRNMFRPYRRNMFRPYNLPTFKLVSIWRAVRDMVKLKIQ